MTPSFNVTCPEIVDQTKSGIWDGSGVPFATYSASAKGVQVCLIDGDGNEEKVDLRRGDDHVWRARIADIPVGQHFNYRYDGDYDPNKGKRFNPAKPVIDLFCPNIAVTQRWNNDFLPYEPGHDEQDLWKSDRDSGPVAYHSVVSMPLTPDPEAIIRSSVPWSRAVITEAHVGALTPDGTFIAASKKETVDFVKSTGANIIEFQPIAKKAPENNLYERGLDNFWGYQPLSFAALETQYGSWEDFKTMVTAYNNAGIDVVIDVVYNHTGEGNQLGPSLSFRGTDNETYYRPQLVREKEGPNKGQVLIHDDGRPVTNPRYYEECASGVGNLFNMSNPQAQKNVKHSLKQMIIAGVRGFRFDLLGAVSQNEYGQFDPEIPRAIVRMVKEIVAEVKEEFPAKFAGLEPEDIKLIGEPWDCTNSGDNYEYGPEWKLWNRHYREGTKLEDRVGLPATEMYNLLTEFSGNTILYNASHDGYTPDDSVAYESKHNEANGNNNTDGPQGEATWNSGVEGPTDDPNILALREKRVRNSTIAEPLLSIGVPMIPICVYFNHSTGGNDNPYCQQQKLDSNKINKDRVKLSAVLSDFHQKINSQPTEITVYSTTGMAYRQPGEEHLGTTIKSENSWVKALVVQYQTAAVGQPAEKYLLVDNSHWDAVDTRLAALPDGQAWELIADTRSGDKPAVPENRVLAAPGEILRPEQSRCKLLFKAVNVTPDRTDTALAQAARMDRLRTPSLPNLDSLRHFS